MLRRFAERTRLKSVCLAGGVAFNCVANGKIFEATPFEQVYVQPAAGDGGLSVGAAFFVWHQVLGQPRSFVMDHAYWGPEYSHQEICRAVDSRSEEHTSELQSHSDLVCRLLLEKKKKKKKNDINRKERRVEVVGEGN